MITKKKSLGQHFLHMPNNRSGSPKSHLCPDKRGFRLPCCYRRAKRTVKMGSYIKFSRRRRCRGGRRFRGLPMPAWRSTAGRSRGRHGGLRVRRATQRSENRCSQHRGHGLTPRCGADLLREARPRLPCARAPGPCVRTEPTSAGCAGWSARASVRLHARAAGLRGPA